jgi:hypothetical protein
MQMLEKIFFVVSTRNHRTGEINYELADNYTRLPRGVRRVFGTGHYDRGLVMKRLQKCRDGVWFKEQHKERRKREEEDTRVRQRIHRDYLRSVKRRKQRA